MGTTRKPGGTPPKRAPRGKTIADRENDLIAGAIDLAEKQIREGTASSQVLTHFLKLATTREVMEKELLEQRIVLETAKAEHLESAKRTEKLVEEALQAMRSYKGAEDDD